MRRRHPILLGLAVLALGVGYFFVHGWTPPPPDRYPEFLRVDAALKSRLVAALDHRVGDFAARVTGATPIALLAAQCERFPEWTGTILSGPYHWDENNEPIGWNIAERRDPSLNDLLLRIATDETLGAPPRKTAIVGICWAGNETALPGLVSFLLDLDTNEAFRKFLLERLHRIGTTPDERFRDLLYLPFDGLDVPAAATLALVGEPIAPSLILNGLQDYGGGPAAGVEHLCVRAIGRIAPDDPEISALVRRTLPVIEQRKWSSTTGETADEMIESSLRNASEIRRKEIAALADRFDVWLEAHPEAFRNRYEEERAAYRASERRVREMRLQNFEDVVATPEEELDFASASLIVGRWGQEHDATNLDRIDRLARYFRRKLAGVEGIVDRMAVLHRTLLTRHRTTSGWRIEDGSSSFLDEVIRDRAGNCVGLTSLYLALGDRLGMPLSAVKVPRHVYLRYDDGREVVDFELTDLGRVRTAADLEGATPRVLTRKELLSAILSNRSCACLRTHTLQSVARPRLALKFAEQALRLDPKNDAAHLARAQALVSDSPGNAEQAMAAVRRAIELDSDDPAAVEVMAGLLLALDRPEEALAWYDRAHAADPDSRPVQAGRLEALLALGRYEDAVTFADEVLDGAKVPFAIRLRRFRALLHLDNPRWSGELGALPRTTVERWDLTIETAGALLSDGRRAPPDPWTALRLLRGLKVLRKHADEAEPSGYVFIDDGDGGKMMLRREVVNDYWNRARALEAEAIEKLRD